MNPYQVQTKQPKFDWDDITRVDGIVDDLGREEIADSIARDLRGPERSRILGIYGWWGAGKSYLLSLVIRRIFAENDRPYEKKRILVATFHPWRYEIDGSLAPGLIWALHDLADQFVEQQSSFLGDPSRWKPLARRLLDLIAETTPLVPAGQPWIAIGGKVIAKATSLTASDTTKEKPRVASINELREQMQALVNEILLSADEKDRDREHRLVIFIDDLDRCSPENMVRMFEWLKVHLRVEGCTYVLALDHVAAARAIVGRYREYLTNEKDLAYGFRYLEKLVDNEYELQLAPQVEVMALKQIYGRSTGYSRLSEVARSLCGGDFPGIQSMNTVLEIRSLQTPRTMLKIIYRYKKALDVVLGDAAKDFRSQLPAAYPFWLLFLTAMYYRLDPDDMDEFVRGRGSIYELLRGTDVKTEEWGSGPHREFCQYAARFSETAGIGMQLPPLLMLARLASIVRENVFVNQIAVLP